ncbi:MAG: hypothetical protein HZC48_00595 [Nitrospirae bacterium]|nr:hypothetical protein [Nitrospirota bacterium]
MTEKHKDHRTIASTPTRNNAGLILAQAVARAGEAWRVCRTWHRTYGVEVPVPGRSRAEGKEKGNSIK